MKANPVRMQDEGENGSGQTPGRGTLGHYAHQAQNPQAKPLPGLLLNDDYTPMDFVIHILERFFQKDREAATRIMLHVHHHGVGELRCVYLRDCRDQSDTGDGFRPAASASAAVRHGKEMRNDRADIFTKPEKALHQALTFANERHHEYATLEHLLLALIEDSDAAAVMGACNVNLDVLRKTVADYVDNELANLVTGYDEDSKPTAGFQRVIQRAVIHVQSSGREEVTGANVWSRSSPSAKAMRPISCRSRR